MIGIAGRRRSAVGSTNWVSTTASTTGPRTSGPACPGPAERHRRVLRQRWWRNPQRGPRADQRPRPHRFAWGPSRNYDSGAPASGPANLINAVPRRALLRVSSSWTTWTGLPRPRRRWGSGWPRGGCRCAPVRDGWIPHRCADGPVRRREPREDAGAVGLVLGCRHGAAIHGRVHPATAIIDIEAPGAGSHDLIADVARVGSSPKAAIRSLQRAASR